MKQIILVVDDDKSNLCVAQNLLSDEYRIALANSGELALKYLEKNIPDLILLDIQMPNLDGFEVIKILQANPKYVRIPVIFLTADRSDETEEKCFKLGAVDYIGKPFVPAIMRQRVKRTLELEFYRKNLEMMVEQQLQRITQLQQDIIITMANLIESRDGTTGEHVKRTSIYVKHFLRKLVEKGIYSDKLTSDFVKYIEKATPLHDIGKIVVPDYVLQKPGKLTAEEYQMIQQHSAEGAVMIRKNMSSIEEVDFVDIACDIAAYHHEKWSGCGYPNNLKGEEIPLSARIVAIADVFDALASKRQYKEAMTIDQAFEIMESQRNVSFEPILLDVFFEMKEELQELMREFD